MKKVSFVAFIVFAAVLAHSLTAFAAEVTMMSTKAVEEALSSLLPKYEKASGNTVKTIWDGTTVVPKRITRGEMADIVIVPAPVIDDLIKQGKLVNGSRLDFVKSKVGAAVRPGALRPDISSSQALKTSLLAAKSIIISAGPSGIHMADLFRKMGIYDALKPKLKQLAPGQQVGDALVRGDGDLGFTQISEFLMIKGVDYVGPLPEDVQYVTLYSIGLHAKAPAKDAALTLIKFLTTPEVAAAIRSKGMEPAF